MRTVAESFSSQYYRAFTAAEVSLGIVLKHSLAWGACSCTTLINFSNSRKLLGFVLPEFCDDFDFADNVVIETSQLFRGNPKFLMT